jgi:hypothetical protein
MKDDIRDLILNNVQKDQFFSEHYDLVDHLDYNGGLHEIIDSHIDIYYYDLRKWAVDNYNFIDEAIGEGFCEGVTDFHKLIQCGQLVQLASEANDYVEELYEELKGVAFNTSEPDEPEEEEPKAQPEAPQKFTEVLLEGAERDAYIKARFNQ